MMKDQMMMLTCHNCEVQIDSRFFDADERMCLDCLECTHDETTYQPWEQDTNAPESLTCDSCGKELELPEPNEELL